MADDLDKNNREWAGAGSDSHDSQEKEREIDGLLQSWQVDPPPNLEERIWKEVRALKPTAPRRWRGELRVPWWLAAACLALLAVMFPLAIRGLQAGAPALLSPGPPTTELAPPGHASSMVTQISSATNSYLTVADLSRLRPTRDVNIQILKAKEAQR